jgi:hypothetical protein
MDVADNELDRAVVAQLEVDFHLLALGHLAIQIASTGTSREPARWPLVS